MLALATRYAGSRGLAEDIVQDTWLGVIKGIGRFEGRSTLKTWIFRILHYRARSASSKEAHSITFSALAGASRSGLTHEPHDPHVLMARAAARCAHDAPEEQAIRSEAGMLIASAIACLPKAQRAVVVLRDVAGWTAAEVCKHLELSAVYQRVLLYRARHHMRRTLNSYRKDTEGNNVFQGGFLGMDNVGVFDRSAPCLPAAIASRATARPGWACSV